MIWHTWLAFFGAVAGLVGSAMFGWPPLRTAAIGFAGGLAAVTVVNILDPEPAPCLQEARHADILRAYALTCAVPDR